MYISPVEHDLHYRFGDALEQMVHHSIPFYVVESCPLPPRPSGAPPMEEMLNVTLEPGSQRTCIHHYCHVPNWDIHHPEPWICEPVTSPLGIQYHS